MKCLGHNHDDHEHDHYYDDSVLHDNQYVFFRHYLDMIDGCEEGLQYITNNRDRVIISNSMLNDCIDALKAIQEANFLAWSIMEKIDLKAYEAIRKYDSMVSFIEEAEEHFEALEINQVFNTIEQNIIPQYISWANSVSSILDKHIPKN